MRAARSAGVQCMNCDRLKKQIKNWYLHVQSETMAPARMVSFMRQHLAECEECLADPDVRQEVEKISVIVLPPSKKTKAEEEKQAISSPQASGEPTPIPASENHET